MNLFYAPPDQIDGEYIELREQEARHVSKVLRYGEGDSITVVDGEGGWYEGKVLKILKDSVQVEVQEHTLKEFPCPKLVLGLGILKNRDRLEFAVEKGVELGAMEIALFRSAHSVKENVRLDRLQAAALSAMKQSLRAYLPKVRVFDTLESVIDAYTDHKALIAHEKSSDESGVPESSRSAEKLLLLVGPEGGFSEEEIDMVRSEKHSGEVVSLGKHRLRTETAALVFLSRFI